MRRVLQQDIFLNGVCVFSSCNNICNFPNHQIDFICDLHFHCVALRKKTNYNELQLTLDEKDNKSVKDCMANLFRCLRMMVSRLCYTRNFLVMVQKILEIVVDSPSTPFQRIYSIILRSWERKCISIVYQLFLILLCSFSRVIIIIN